MTSRRLGDFLTAFCGVDEDLDETARALRSAPDSELARWLRRSSTPRSATVRCRLRMRPSRVRRFDSDTAVVRWLADRRREWFALTRRRDRTNRAFCAAVTLRRVRQS